MRVVATPAYLTQDAEARAIFEALAFAALSPEPQSQPSMVFGDPDATQPKLEDPIPMDDGTTQFLSAIVPVVGTQKLWCKRDDYPDGPVFTFLTPSDY